MHLPEIPFSGLAASLVETLWRASWQGGLAIFLVWAVCRLFPAVPASWRHWLWRIVALKCALLLALPANVGLSLIPRSLAHPGESPSALGGRLPHAPDDRTVRSSPFVSGNPIFHAHSRREGEVGQAAQAETTDDVLGGKETAPRDILGVLWSLLALMWMAGVAVCLVRLSLHGMCIRRIIRESEVVRSGEPAFEAACGRLRLERPPSLRCSRAIQSPQLVRFLKPVILVPGGVTVGLTARDWELAFTHELTHLKRQDLSWNLLLVAVQTVLFFHPLVWLARREWCLTQEVAVDEATLASSHASPAEYGQLLLKLCGRFRFSPLSVWSIGMADTARNLKHRIQCMKVMNNLSPMRLRFYAVLVLLVACGTGIPFQLTARAAEEPPATSEEAAATGSSTGKADRAAGTKDSTPDQGAYPRPQGDAGGVTIHENRTGTRLSARHLDVRTPGEQPAGVTSAVLSQVEGRIQILEAELATAHAKLELAERRLASEERHLAQVGKLHPRHAEFEMGPAEAKVGLLEARVELLTAEAQLEAARQEASRYRQATTAGGDIGGVGRTTGAAQGTRGLKPEQVEKIKAILSQKIELGKQLERQTQELYATSVVGIAEVIEVTTGLLALQQEEALLEGDLEKARQFLKERIDQLAELAKIVGEQAQAGNASAVDVIKTEQDRLSLEMELAALEGQVED